MVTSPTTKSTNVIKSWEEDFESFFLKKMQGPTIYSSLHEKKYNINAAIPKIQTFC
jgi:hypothetical protein